MLATFARILAIALAVFLPTVSAVSADDSFYAVGNDTLFRLDLDGPDHELIGPIGHTVAAIAGDRQGRLFGADKVHDVLIEIDRATGAGSVVGAFGQDIAVTDLSFDDDGRLWAVGCSVAPDCPTRLIEIDPTTGEAQLDVEILTGPGLSGLAIIDGVFYVGGPSRNLGILDPSTGVITDVQPNPEPCIGSRGAAGTRAGALWISSHNFCALGPIEPWNLVQLDLQTGLPIGTGATDGRSLLPASSLRGPAIVSDASNPIPTIIDVQEPVYGDQTLVADVTYPRRWCFDRAETTVSGDRIDILAREICGCMGGPTPGMFQAEVGPLPIGPYRITLDRQGFDGVGEPCEERETVAGVDTNVSTRPGISRIVTDPATPTSEDDVSLVVTVDCTASVILESLVDGVIWIRSSFAFLPTIPCLEPSTEIVPLGHLAAGSYTIIVREDEGDEAAFSGLSRFEVVDLGSPAITLASRYRVEATWTRGDGTVDVARGRLVEGSDIGAELYFARPSNPELLVKLLDGCANNGHRWFFAGGLTNLGVVITVTDLVTGEEVVYDNPVGQDFSPILDTQAFACE